jgi:hypothetical protein
MSEICRCTRAGEAGEAARIQGCDRLLPSACRAFIELLRREPGLAAASLGHDVTAQVETLVAQADWIAVGRWADEHGVQLRRIGGAERTVADAAIGAGDRRTGG